MDIKNVVWLADTRARIKEFPIEACQSIGKNLLHVQLGLKPVDWKPFGQMGLGLIEIRVHRPHEYRLVYTIRFHSEI